MTEIVVVALIGVGGSVLVAIVSIITQHFNTKSIINLEEKSRTREKRIDRIINDVSDLLATSDPQSSEGVDYGKTTNLIIRVQLLLDLNNDFEKALNDSLNDLGNSLQEYYPVKARHIDNKITETKALLEAHSKVIEKTRACLKHYIKSL